LLGSRAIKNAIVFNFVYSFSMMNCALIDVVPLEFFYLENIGSFFGSYAVFYMGVYGYGTLVTFFNTLELLYRIYAY
jgi:hypothetical protein